MNTAAKTSTNLSHNQLVEIVRRLVIALSTRSIYSDTYVEGTP